MMKCKRLISLFVAFIMIFATFLTSGITSVFAEEKVITVFSVEDYIHEAEDDSELGVLDMFAEETGITVNYLTFATNEDMYNELKKDPFACDLICPSEYMIMKMMEEDLLRPFKTPANFKEYGSPYIKDVFKGLKIGEGENAKPFMSEDEETSYAVGYRWGTVGLIYNMNAKGGEITAEDFDSWSNLWTKFTKRLTIKDSIRDSYFMGIAYANKETLDSLATDYENGLIELSEYQTAIRAIFNDTSEENVKKVEEGLKALKGNIYGFEVDSGKNDIASGKITINFAWSGDAVYAMDEAEGQGVELYYTVPDEGSNVWFDGWCVPASSNNVDLAVKFIEFLSDPEIVVRNMEYIGYTSGMGGQAVFDNAIDWYGVCTLEESELTKEEYLELSEDDMEYYELCADGTVYEYVYAEDLVYGNDEDGYFADIVYFDEETESVYTEETEIYKVDLGYFFGDGEWIVYTDTIGRQFTAQYPTKDIIDRCVVMNCYDEEANARVTLMWERVKGFTFANWVIILLTVLIVLSIAFVVCFKYKEKLFKKKVANRNFTQYIISSTTNGDNNI